MIPDSRTTEHVDSNPTKSWTRRDSNPKPLPCKGSALPLSYGPGCKKKQTVEQSITLLSFLNHYEKEKEVIHPQVPLQIPCDDLTHLTDLWFATIKKLKLTTSLLGWFDGRCVQGAGTYSPDDANV